jgi:hypothetical protein
MFKQMKGKKPWLLVLGAGIISLAAFGIYQTVDAYSNIQQAQSPGYTTGTNMDPTSGGCNPLGCSFCSGCVKQQYEQSVESIPDSASRIELIE